ncbi:MAG: PorT family protein [Fibromonadaceae bacterium]|jgi:hypothetical protein|nr:PorT family protein [Fibromonadaceae bacterium]
MRNVIRAGSACLLFVALCFAQEAPPKLAVYVSGASGGINKSLGSKLLSAMSQSGSYTQIADPALLQDELASSSKGDLAYIAQTAKRHGAEYVCVVSMTEAFGAHSITARLARVSDLQIIKTGTTDRALRSLDDLTAVSNELARQLLPPGNYTLPTAPATLAVAPTVVAGKEAPADTMAAPAGPKGECDKKYNLNELIYKIKDRFPTKLKDCSSTLAKDMLNPFGKKLEPKSFMTQCTIDGIKNELPEGFPNKDKIVGSLTDFMQGIMNAAMAGGSVDPKKLLSAVASMDIMRLVSDVKKLAADECVVDEPYEPPAAPTGGDEEEKKEKGKSMVSFGIRAGANFSHTYAEYTVRAHADDYGESFIPKSGSGNYGDILGIQAGFVVDFAVSDLFHIQPGLMYIQKGMEDGNGEGYLVPYIELPLLLSFKLDALRLNVGPYYGWHLFGSDIGLSTGIGFDIGMFYIGAFYDYGFFNVAAIRQIYNDDNKYKLYNRTFGLNLGINL